jgi:hypothetical protein
MTRAIQEPKYRNIYFYLGLHFNTLKAPLQNPDQEVFNVLLASLARWQQECSSTTDPELQRQCSRVLRFLSRELKTNFTPSHLAQLNADIESRLSNAEDSSQQEDRQENDSTARGVIISELLVNQAKAVPIENAAEKSSVLCITERSAICHCKYGLRKIKHRARISCRIVTRRIEKSAGIRRMTAQRGRPTLGNRVRAAEQARVRTNSGETSRTGKIDKSQGLCGG